MLTVIVYDISADKTRTRMHQLLSEYGVPVQESAFEARLTPTERERLIERARTLVDEETDRFVMYGVSADQEERILVLGQHRPPLIEPKFYMI